MARIRHTSRVLLALGAIVCLGWSSQDRAGEAYELKSRHYVFVTDLDRDTADRVTQHMDHVYDEYARRFGSFGVRDASPLKVWVFQNQDDYLVHLHNSGINGMGSGGMFFVTTDDSGLACFAGDRPIEGVLETLRHEGLHQFAYQRLSKDLPQWVNEGMAEYFGYALETERGLLPGVLDPGAVMRLKAAMHEGRDFPLAELLFIDNARWNEMVRTGDERAALLYDQSWSVVHFLVNADDGRYEKLLMQYLRAAWQGKSVQQASTEVFGSDLESMQRTWESYAQTLEPDPLLEAKDQLEVYAMALQPLFEKGLAPTTVDELRDMAREHGFAGRVLTSVGVREVSPEDEWWLTPPESARTNKRARVRLSPDRRGVTPPGVEIRGLRRSVRLRWKAGRDGTLSHTVVVG